MPAKGSGPFPARQPLTSPDLGREFLRYFMAGGGAFLADYLVLFASVQGLGLHYLAGATLGFITGSLCIYGLSTRWVFSRRTRASRVHEFTLFVLVGILGLLLNLFIMWVLTGWLAVHYLLSKLAATAIVFLFNFGSRKYLLF
jgi:putative flippase GtrA